MIMKFRKFAAWSWFFMISGSGKPKQLVFSSLMVALLLTPVGCPVGADHVDHWPSYTPHWQSLAAMDRQTYIQTGENYTSLLEDYSPTGNYFNSQSYYWGDYLLDADGFPVDVDNQLPDKPHYYNPVTTAQYGLTQYALYLSGQQSSAKFLSVANHLISLMSSDGALRYPIPWDYHTTALSPGWVSGLAQGTALSVFARAWTLTNDPKWMAAGTSVLNFMLIPTSQGGTRGNLVDLDPSLTDTTTFEEITCHPDCTILNGFLYALLGLYDWGMVTGDRTALATFLEGAKTASNILHYYDIGGFSAYDLRQVIQGQTPATPLAYHSRHIALTNALYSITADPVFRQWRDTWENDVNP
jgi:hypothetical protein